MQCKYISYGDSNCYRYGYRDYLVFLFQVCAAIYCRPSSLRGILFDTVTGDYYTGTMGLRQIYAILNSSRKYPLACISDTGFFVSFTHTREQIIFAVKIYDYGKVKIRLYLMDPTAKG